MTDKKKVRTTLTQYDSDAEDYEAVVPKKRANEILDKEIEKRLKDKLKKK